MIIIIIMANSHQVPALVQEQPNAEDAEQHLAAEHRLRDATHDAHTAVKRAVEAARRADLTLTLPANIPDEIQELVASAGDDKVWGECRVCENPPLTNVFKSPLIVNS